MNGAAARLTLRLGRFEIVTLGLMLVVTIIGSVLAAAHIAGLAPPVACFGPFMESRPASCDDASRGFYDALSTFGGPLNMALVFLPFAAGLFLGVPIVGREIERGTTRLAWSLAPSRWRWYLARLLPALALVAVLSFLAGYAADRMLAAAEPGLDVEAAFEGFGLRGVVLASRAVFVFTIGVAVGAIVGRLLPAIIITAIVAAVGIAGGTQVHHRILAGEVVPVAQDAFRRGDLWMDTRFQLPDGSLVGWDHFTDSDPYDQFGVSRYPEFTMVVPGERYRLVETREGLVLAAASLGALLIGGFVVARRRPG